MYDPLKCQRLCLVFLQVEQEPLKFVLFLGRFLIYSKGCPQIFRAILLSPAIKYWNKRHKSQHPALMFK